MSTIQEIESQIEHDRSLVIAAGLRAPAAPRRNSWTATTQYLDNLKSYRMFTLDPLMARIGQPSMQKPKLTAATVNVMEGSSARLADGYRFTFPQYPGVEWFVYRGRVAWRVAEYSSGMLAGGATGSNRSAAILAQWDVLENMRMAKNHGGSSASVIEYIKKCVASATIITP